MTSKINGKKVIFNTGILYIKMFTTVGVTLYSTRLVLTSLGVVDFGIYNLVAGTIAMLSFLNAAMTTSTQRFFSYHHSNDSLDLRKRIFCNSMILHFFISIILVALLACFIFILFDGFLNIPKERVYAAKIVYKFMIVSIFFTVNTVPYSALLTAHENMFVDSVINVIDVFLKLICAFILSCNINLDKLIFYSLLISIVGFINFILYAVYCIKYYTECCFQVRKYLDKSQLKVLASFASWNLFGALCGLGKTQGVAIIINIFYGAVMNSAYAVANQITGQMSSFSSTMLRAMNPQIMKSEGNNNRNDMLFLSMMACKYGYYLLAFLAIPAIFQMTELLNFWLTKIPNYAPIFCSLTLIAIMVNQLTVGLQSAIQAVGKIKIYQSIVGSIQLANLPISFLLLKFDYAVYSVLISAIFIEFSACTFRVFLLYKIANLSIRDYFNKVIIKIIIPTVLSILFCFLIGKFTVFRYGFVLNIAFCSCLNLFFIYLFGLEKIEKQFINNIIIQKIRR